MVHCCSTAVRRMKISSQGDWRKLAGRYTLSDLQIKHFAVWRDERLLKVKPNTVMQELRILRVLLDWARDERGAEIKDNPARQVRVRGTRDARAPFFTREDEKNSF